MPAQQLPHLMGLPDFKQLVLYTGNVMRTSVVSQTKKLQKISNAELMYAIDDTIKSSLQSQDAPSFCYFSDESLLEVPDLRHNSIISLDDREDVEVTAKLFMMSDIYPEVDEAISLLRKLLGLSTIDSFVLSSPSFPLVLKAWKVLETYYHQGVINKLGVSDLAEEQLKNVLQNPAFDVKPMLNQVSYSCCDIPTSMINLAKENNVDLLYTLDCQDILSRQELTQLLQTTGVINEKKSMAPRWVLKYDVFVKNRSIVADKGYIVVGDVESS